MKTDCPTDYLSNRVTAGMDVMHHADNSEMIVTTSNLAGSLHYVAARVKFATEAPNHPGPLAPPKSDPYGVLKGELADFQYRPSDILGDKVTQDLLDSYDKFSELVAGEQGRDLTPQHLEALTTQKDGETIRRFRKQSGLTDAVHRAEKLIEATYKNDEPRLEYGRAWLKRFQGGNIPEGQFDQIMREATGNLSQNLLMNNIRAGLQNHLQLATTTLPEFGFQDTHAGVQMYLAARKSNSPELKEAQIGKGRFYAQKGFDFFSLPENFNQGVTYFAAKAKALRGGATDAEARQAGKRAIEKTQFKNRAGNEPRAYWGPRGSTHLGLLSYGIQMKRLHDSWVKGAWEGYKKKDASLFKKNATALMYYAGANALINGVTSDIPDEIGLLLKAAAPRFYNGLRQLDRVSLMGALDLDTAELARIPLTGWGFLAKVPVLYDKVDSTVTSAAAIFAHPDDPMKWIKAIKAGSMFAPPVPVIGNKNLGNLVEFVYRSLIGNWDVTVNGKKVHSNPAVVLKTSLTGQSLDQDLKTARR